MKDFCMRCLNFAGFSNLLACQIFARKDFYFCLVSWASEKLRNYHILEIPIQHLRDYLLGLEWKTYFFADANAIERPRRTINFFIMCWLLEDSDKNDLEFLSSLLFLLIQCRQTIHLFLFYSLVIIGSSLFCKLFMTELLHIKYMTYEV